MRVCPECERQYGEDVEFCAHDGSRLRAVDETSEDPLIGRMLDGRWRIDEKIGEGGMGAIYLASQETVGREVAVKTLRTALSENQEFSERFMREARVTSTINHPHCVTIFDFGQTENNTLYLAMEYLQGEPLADRMDRGTMEVRTILEIGIQVASALSAAHEHEVVHRDLKPDNIFLLDISDGSTFTKVLDFGISKDLGDDDDLTKTGQIFGTPQYMSPEQARGNDLDPRSDLYSLGCILFEMLAERPPFDGDKSMEILVAHVQDDLPSLRDVAQREIPDRVVEVVEELLAKERADRPDSAEEVRRRLEAIFEDLVGTESGTAAVPSEAEGASAATGSAPAETGADRGGNSGEAVAHASTGPSDPAPGDGAGGAATPRQPRGRSAETPQVASTAGGGTQEHSQPGWFERNRGLVVGVLGLALLVGVLVVGGVGYLLYRSGTDGEGPLAAWLGPSGAQRTAAAEPAADNDEAEPGESSSDPSDEESPDEGSKSGGEASAGAGDDEEAKTGSKSGADHGEATAEAVDEAGGRAEEGAEESPKGAGDEFSGKGSGSEGEEPDDSESGTGSESGAGEKTAQPDRESDESEETSLEEAFERAEGGGSESSKESGASEAAESGPAPAEFVRRKSLSATGSACNKPDVQQRLSALEAQLGRCYRQGSGGSGELMLEWTISTAGKPLQVAPLTSSVDSSTETCAIRAVEGLSFAPPSGGRCYTRVTFRFGR